MAYIVDGKIYTDHSLLDEIVYNTKLILDRIVLKNLKVADQYETAYSMEQADYLLAINNGSMDLSIFPLTAEILTSYGYNPIQVRAYLLDRSTIPEEDREDLLSFCNQWFLDHYEETNFYYRMLNGLPEYGTDEYNVYIDPNNPKLIPDNGRTDFNFSAPLHEYTIAQLNTLETLGIMDDIYAEYTDKHHRYLKYIGAYKIDIVTARSAGIWDILYMPIVEPMVSDRFTELYNINRDIYYRRTFQDAYKLESDYYDEMCMLMIICQTYTDMIVDTPEWYIRRDIFDLRTCEYFLTSQGVEFFKEIPLKYQIRIVKNLNKLIKYKSTTKNIYDILEIFSVEGTTVYKYYLYKKYLYTAYEEVNPEPEPDPGWEMEDEYDYGDEELTEEVQWPQNDPNVRIDDFLDENEGDFDVNSELQVYEFGDEDGSEPPTSEDTDKEENNKEETTIIVDEVGNVYDLEFVRVPIGENYDDYIKDSMNRVDYDTITYQDPYWDGEDTHYYVKNRHLEKDFSIEGTKYMTLEYKVSMEEFTYQSSYFLGMIFQSGLDLSKITVGMPAIKPNAYFPLQTLFIFLICLSALYNGKGLQITFPGNVRTGQKDPYTNYPRNYDGGFPWSGDDPEPEPEPEPEPGWELTDMDFGDEDVEDIIVDQYTEWYDFGYQVDIDYNEIPFYNYDFGNEELPDEEVTDPDPEEPEEPTDPPEYPWDDQEKGYWKYNLDGKKPDVNQIYRLNADGGEGRYSEITHESHYDWMRWKYPYFWVDTSGHIYSFRLNADMDTLRENVGVRHSAFGFERGYTLEELGVDKFITTTSAKSFSELIRIYNTNTECYENIKELLINASSRDEKRVFQYVYDYLFTQEYPYNFYRLNSGEYAENYLDLLQEKDYTLYTKYVQISMEPDEEVRKDIIRELLNEIVDTLSYYLAGADLDYIFNFVPTHSFDAIIHYISLMIEFFKSWKVYFLDPTVTYVLDDKAENTIPFQDGMAEIKFNEWKYDQHRLREYISIKIVEYLMDNEFNQRKEFLDIYARYEAEKPDLTYDGGGVEDISDTSVNPVYDSVTEDLPIVDGLYDLDGGNIADDEPGYLIDTPSPFFQVNSGKVAARVDVFDLDGGGALDMQHYLTVDGREATYEPTLMGQEFEELVYDVDGGGVSVYRAETDTTITKIDGGKVTVDVKISPYNNNGIAVVEDGLTVGSSTMLDHQDIEDQQDEMELSKEDYIDILLDYLNTVGIYGNYDTMVQIVDKIFDDKFHSYEEITTDFERNLTKNEFMEYLNSRTAELRQWFIDLDLFAWGEF